MKTLKMICTAVVLMLALSMSTFGGEITTPGLTGEAGTPGVIRPETDPQAPETPNPDAPETDNLGSTTLDAVLLALGALF